MSTYSTQINAILRDRLVPKMCELSMEVAKIEPYSYSNTRLEDSKRQLDYMAMLYDFLYEYAIGVEELENGKLVSVVRLIDPPNRERRVLELLSRGNQRVKRNTAGYKLLIDKLEYFPNDTFITPGSEITITIIYTSAVVIDGEKSISAITGGATQTSNGFEIVIQNKTIPLTLGGTNLTITAQAMEDSVPIGAPQVYTIPIAHTIDSTFYYGVGAQALDVAGIQALTKFWEPRGSKTLLFSPINQVYYFAYPQSYGDLVSIRDTNGFNITTDWTKTVRTFTLSLPNYAGGTSPYNVYEFKNLTTQTNFDITFNF